MGEDDQVNEFCIAIDKLDKVGKENVIQELITRGFDRLLWKSSHSFLICKGLTNINYNYLVNA